MPFTTKILWEEQVEKLKELVIQGKTCRQIGAIYGVSAQTISCKLKLYNLKHSLAHKREVLQNKYYRRWGDTTMALYKTKRSKYKKKLYNAKKRGIEFTLEFSDLDWPTHCPVLGIEINYSLKKMEDTSISFDRIDPSKGYTKENTLLVSQRANRLKNDASFDELKQIYNYFSKYF